MGKTKTLGQIAAEAYCNEPVPWDDAADPKWREHWATAAAAVRKAVLEEAIEAISSPLTIAACEDAIAAAQDLQELHIEALQRLIGETSIGVMPPAEQADQSVSAQAPLQSGNHREAE